jgi:hypothetical protein
MSFSKLGWAVCLGLLLSATPAPAQTPNAPQSDAAKPAPARASEYPNLKKQAEALVQAFMAGDYKKFITFNYPRVVELAGGPEAMADSLSRGMRDMEAKGLKLLSYTVGEPEPATRIGQGLYAIVPTTMRARVPAGVLVQASYFVGISRDGGENWTFLGGSGGGSEAQLRAILPETGDKLKFPQIKPPTIEQKQ